jgi:hypothetical protein
MPAGPALLEVLAGLIQRTYGFHAGLGDLGRFVVGDLGYRRLRSRGPVVRTGRSLEEGARLLLRSEGAHWAAAIYYPDALIEQLERHDPRQELGDHNVDAFAVFVEELDHLLTLADRARPGRPALTLLELEWHAEVTKYLSCAHFLARTRGLRRLGPAQRLWLRFRLFERAEYAEPDPEVNARYREARRRAVRLLDRIQGLLPAERIAYLRAFHREGHSPDYS